MIKSLLIDNRNFDKEAPQIIEKIKSASLIGFDIETEDSRAHDGIKKFRGKDGAKAFDLRRTVVCGFSLYADNDDTAYYVNLNHKDKENIISWEQAKTLLDAKRDSAYFVCHNAPFEITNMKACLDYDLPEVICTLQMAVSAYGPDEYDHDAFVKQNFGGITTLFADAEKLFKSYDPYGGREKMTFSQNELLGKVLAKTSDAHHSYNGLIKELSYSYGLKKMVKKFFGFDMVTFKECLGDAAHMGELTGDETCSYGADDSYWAIRLYHHLHDYILETNPSVMSTFFTQENPMIHVYSDIRLEGLKVNHANIEKRRQLERSNYAQKLRETKAVVKELLPFPVALNEKLAKYNKWYEDKYEAQRQQVIDWAKSPDCESDYDQCCQVSSPVTNAWAGEKVSDFSIGHYYKTRLFMYDLTESTPIVQKGKVQSDGEARGKLKERLELRLKNSIKDNDDKMIKKLENSIKLLDLMNDIASIEQRMKLYLTPYSLLTDPETNRMYPQVSSQLATRRMASSNPNPMQLSKRGESTYVRGFYIPDEDDHIFISIDWSQIELVLIGEFSGDPEFRKAYGEIPYNDLHLGAAADVLGVVIEGVTPELLKNLATTPDELIPPKLLIKPSGEKLEKEKATKYWRTEVGKGSNFNYWYSGALSTVGEKLGWSPDQMWAATDAYRKRFAVAESWRVGTIDRAKWDGYVVLPDHHRRTRWEITHEWASICNRMLEQYQNMGYEGTYKFGCEILRGVRTRAGNQLVNALIQGTSATLAKRSILAARQEIEKLGLRARFKLPIHDELLFSVHREDAIAFLHMIKPIMCNHPDIINSLRVHTTASIGLNFEPFDEEKVPLGQVEIDEAPPIIGFQKDSVLNDNEISTLIDHLFEERASGKE